MAVVTPFMQDANYAPRNFATLGQSELLPPFTGDSKKKRKPSLVIYQAPGRRQALYIVLSLCKAL